MADNIAITAGSGTTVATDDLTDAGGAHVQYVKLMDGAANSAAKIGGDAANGLDVDVTRLPALVAGAAVIGALTANQSVNNAQVAGAATSVGSGTTGTGTQRVIQAGPASADILVGHQAFTATTAATTIITIPANRTWVGTVTVTCDVANIAAAVAVGQALGVITTVGANAVPAAGTVFSCEARCGANAAAGTVASQGSCTASTPMVVATGAATATLALTSTQAGTNSRVAATASGVLI